MNETRLFQLRDIRKEYGSTLAVDLDRLEVRCGEILCLLGPTGSGKSTLLRLLGAVEEPTRGELLYRERPLQVNSFPWFERRQITMVFQRPMLLHGTVTGNVEYGLRLRHERSTSDARVASVLDRLGCAKLANQSARTLSGGQIQLVALARALVLEPSVLLLDEPTANLDPAYVALVERVIQEDFQTRRMTIIWATHNLFQARRVAQRVGLLLGGRLVEVGANDDFFHSPSDPRTQDFVEGRMVY